MVSPGKPSPFWKISPLKKKRIKHLAQSHQLINPMQLMYGQRFGRRPNIPEIKELNPQLEKKLVGVATAMTQFRAKTVAWGLENIPETGVFLVACSHVAQMDVFVPMIALHHCGRRPRFMAKAELGRIPIIGQWGRAMGMESVQRQSGQAIDIEKRAIKTLEDGHPLVIWPEGTLTRDPLKWPMSLKNGMAEIALTASHRLGYQIPLIPSVTWGGTNIHWWRPFPRRHMVLVFGKPIDYSDLLNDPQTWTNDEWASQDAVIELSNRVRQVMEDIEAEIRGEEPPHEGLWDYKTQKRIPRPTLHYRSLPATHHNAQEQHE